MISVIFENHNPSNIPFFVTNENLNPWISLGSSFFLYGLFSVRIFQKRMQEASQDEIFQTLMCCIEYINQFNVVDGFDSEIRYTTECNGSVTWNLTCISCCT